MRITLYLIYLAQGACIFIAAVQLFVFAASFYFPALLVAIWAIALVFWCRELIIAWPK